MMYSTVFSSRRLSWMSLSIVLLCVSTCRSQNEHIIRNVQLPYPLSFDLSQVSGSFMSYGPDIGNQDGGFFRTLTLSDGQLFIGGKNQLFSVNPENLTLTENVTIMANRNSLNCDFNDNYVQVIQPLSSGVLLVCGLCPVTYCQQYSAQNLSTIGQEFHENDRGLPAGPHHNFSWLLLNGTGSDYEVYSGTYKSFAVANPSNIPGILRTRLVVNPDTEVTVATTTKTQEDYVVNPSAEFVGDPIEYNDRVYFFYREFAPEHVNGGKITYSRVARVCKSDIGAGMLTSYADNFVTFRKARLECSITGKFPFYYNEIQDIYQSTEDSNIVFAVFINSPTGAASSAVCAYRLDEIEELFFQAPFRAPSSAQNLWLEVTTADPITRHLTCPDSSDTYTADQLTTLLNSAQLLNPTIENRLNYEVKDSPKSNPLLVADGDRFTQIVVDEKVFNSVDVMFIGTENGTVLKAYLNDDGSEARIVEEISLNTDGGKTPVLTMLKSSDAADQALFVGTNNGVYKIPFHHCRDYATSRACLDARDPYCRWNNTSCEYSAEGMQDLVRGSGEVCPTIPNTITIVSAPSNQKIYIPNHPINLYLTAEAPEGTNLRSVNGDTIQCDECNNLQFTSFKSIASGKENLVMHIDGLSAGSENCTCTYNLTIDCDMTVSNTFTLIADNTQILLMPVDRLMAIDEYDNGIANFTRRFEDWLSKEAGKCGVTEQLSIENCQVPPSEHVNPTITCSCIDGIP